jgi:transcriptional regulator with XRE-family HTH domain
MLPLELLTPAEAAVQLGERARERRLERALTQREVAERAGVSLASLKRFERTGLISLLSLLRIAVVLDAMPGFLDLSKGPPPRSLDELLTAPPRRKRGRRA